MTLIRYTPYPPLQWAHGFSRTFVVFFALCMLYDYLFLRSDPVLSELTANLYRTFLFGWGGAGMNWLTLVFGIIWVWVIGFLFGGTLSFCMNHCQKD